MKREANARKVGWRRVAIVAAAIAGMLIAAWLFFGLDSPHPKDSPPVQVEKPPNAEAPVQQDQPTAVDANRADSDIASQSKTANKVAMEKLLPMIIVLTGMMGIIGISVLAIRWARK
jgi:flagellar basal body-associated protein FliL